MPALNIPGETIHPRHLTNEEIKDPYLVLVELFSYAHLPDVRESLWGFLKCATTGSLYKILRPREKGDLLHFYEHIVRLVEAAHIIYEEYQKGESPSTPLST